MSRFLTILFLCAAVRPMPAAEKPFAFGAVRFEANRGQVDSAVRYMARARGQQVFFTDSGVVFSPPSGAAIRMTFAGSGRPEWVADGPSSDSISYYVGSDPGKWVKGAPVYDRITWRGVYPGVDLTFYGDGDRLEYDLVLAPGADPSRVRLQFEKPARVTSLAGGILEISEGSTRIHQRVPAIYQETAPGVRRRIAGDFQSNGQNAAMLKVASYNHAQRLVVDPVIEMATYVGGENDDEIVAMAEGFIAGNTRSIAFPEGQPALRGGRDIFVRGMGQYILGQVPRTFFYGTLVLGGSGDDELAGIALENNQGYVSFAGTTTSRDLPSARSSKYNGGASDGFLITLAVYQSFASISNSEYIGGSGEDRITAFSGREYTHAMAGVTDSPDFVISGDVPQKSSGGGKDAFYGIVSPLSGLRIYGYLGGSGDDAGYAVAVRSNYSVWIGGETSSSDFPFAAASGLAGPSDGFLAEISMPLVYSPTPVITVASYRVGGNGADSVRAIATPPSTLTTDPYSPSVLRPFTLNEIGFAGTTTSTDLPVRNAAFPQLAGASDSFAGQWNLTAAEPRWLTYLGGSGVDEITALNMDWAGDLYAGGWTRSADLPVAHAVQPTSAGGEDGMFAVFDANGVLHHLTYFGGSGDDRIRDVRPVYGANGTVARVAGSTTSTDLPQRRPVQDRGGQAEGFWADIGTDFLLGPTELIVAKDGVLPFSVRPGRTQFRVPVTYRSSDPARIRLVYLGRSFDEVTAAPEDNIAIEALTDSGEATITITTPGFTTKTILVRLYPGVFVPAVSSSNPISTWASPASLYAVYRALDPATGQPIGVSNMAVRAGAPQPVLNWSVSDPSVFEIIKNGGALQLRVLKAGSATLRLTVDGFTVLQADTTITAAAPRPLPAKQDVFLGKNLYLAIPLDFGVNGRAVTSGYRGTLTARSSDPGRLLLSLASDQPGSESITLTMSGYQPTIYAQALSGEGTVQILLTSSESEGETPINVTLEPAVIAWGTLRYIPTGGSVVDPAVSITAGMQATQLTLRLQGQSGSTASGYRPGAPPAMLKLSNSDPKVVELNRLTRPVNAADAPYTLYGLAVGTAELALTSSSDDLKPASDTVHVEVAAPSSAAMQANLPTTLYVGKGLQTTVTFRYSQLRQAIEIVSSDAGAVLVSPSPVITGSAQLSLGPSQTYSDEYSFQVQALKSEGEARVRLRFPSGEEREIRVLLLASGVGFYGTAGTSTSQGFDRWIRVTAWALDRQTGIGIFTQTPQPGSRISVKIRGEGSPVRFSPSSAVLTPEITQASFNYTLPPAGQEATLILESDMEVAVSPATATMRVHGAAESSTATMLLARNELREYSITGFTSSSALTATSSDPERVLLSTTPSSPASPSVDLSNPGSRLYIHGLADSGNASVFLKSGGVTVHELQIALQPLRLNLSYSNVLIQGGTADYSFSLNASALRPNIGPYRFNVQSTNPVVATVDPATFELVADYGGLRAVLKVSGLAPGTTKLVFEGPPEIIADPVSVTVGEAPELAIPSYGLGKNLQAAVQLDLGASFSNPNGAIVKLTSSDPGRLLLSRSVSTAGTASVSVAVPAGQHLTQMIYLQALEEGDVVIQWTANDVTRTAARIQVARSWVSCTPQGSLVAGSSMIVQCGIRSAASPSGYLDQISPRIGLGDLKLGLESSAPEIFTVNPTSVSLEWGSALVTLRGIAPGTAELRLTPPAGFGPSPDRSESVAVRVEMPQLLSSRSVEMILCKDTQYTYRIPVPAGVPVTATSQDASLLLVSADPKAPGAATAVSVSNGGTVDLTFQALAASGTVEVVFTAPGYQEFRVAVRLRADEVYWTNLPYSGGTVSLKAGSSVTLILGLRSAQSQTAPRAGANIAVDVLMDRAGIVTLDRTRVVLSGADVGDGVKIQGVAPGSVVLRIGAPDGFTASATPAVVSVVP